MTYWRLHYHLVWTTFERRPILTSEREKVLYEALHNKAKELDIKIHAHGNTEDHVHLVVSIPPKWAMLDCLRQFKNVSALAMNHAMPFIDRQFFKWDEGYGAISVSERSLVTIMAYASRQKEHHKAQTTLPLFERFDEQ
jgi:putative transposase